MPRLLLILAALGACTPPDEDDVTSDSDSSIPSEELSVVGFNVESGDAFDDQLTGFFEPVAGEGLWGVTETLNEIWAEKFAEAAADDGVAMEYIQGTTGWEDLITVLWDDARYELMSYEELHEINVGGTVRAPLVARFRSRATDREFLFMVNHLWRSDDNRRHQQAQLLNEWARGQTLPIVAVGDYNFDWSVTNGDNDHDRGYDLMTADGVWQWVRPDPLVATQCAGSVLDFTFVAGPAQEWAGTSEVLFPKSEYCPDNSGRSDHRPVRADFVVE